MSIKSSRCRNCDLDAFLMRPQIDQRRGLLDLMELLPTGLIVAEIGVYLGESSQIFLDSNKIRALYCIDVWENNYDPGDEASYRCDMGRIEKGFDERLKGYNGVQKIKGKSSEVVKDFRDGFFDLVYIDAMHTYDAVKLDISAYLPKIKKTGWIAGHDWGFPGLTEAVIECLGKPDSIFIDGSWLKSLAKR